MPICGRHCSDNHLRNTLSTQRLTPRKLLSLQRRQSIENRRKTQRDSRCNHLIRALHNKTQPQRDCHDSIETRTSWVRVDAAHEGVEFRGCWADPEEEGDFYKYDEEHADSGRMSVEGVGEGREGVQGDDAPDDEEIEGEDAGYSQSKAEEYAEHTTPAWRELAVSFRRSRRLSVEHCRAVQVASYLC